MRKAIILMVIMLFIIQLVNGAQPIPVTQTSITGLIIAYPKNAFYYFNETISFHFHVFNSTGHIVTAPVTSCSLHIYNNTGSHIVENESLNMDSNGIDYSIKLGKDKLVNIGICPYIIACNNSFEGGFISSEIILSTTGEIYKDVETINYEVEKSIFTNSLGIIILLIALFLIYVGAWDLGIKKELNENEN